MSFSESCKSRAAIESKIVSGRSMRSIFLMIEMKEWMGFKTKKDQKMQVGRKLKRPSAF